ncbi:hypothetical protein JCM1840_007267 [Sporobolomyces johnsonii]
MASSYSSSPRPSLTSEMGLVVGDLARWTGARAARGGRGCSFIQLVSLVLSVLAVSLAVHPTANARVASSLRLSGLSSPSRSPPSPLDNPDGILGLSPVAVGPRALPPQYHGRGCNSSQLLRSVRNAHIRPDGDSLRVNYTVPANHHDLSDFRFSYDLEECPPPHLYTPEEACDLLRAFGGMMLRGDSLIRHVVNALFVLLSGRSDGAVDTDGERCRGNAMFDDRAAHCREHSITNSQMMPESVCGGEAYIFFEIDSWGAHPEHLSLSRYSDWLSSLPSHKSNLSPIFISGFGLHHHLNSRTGILGYIRPFLARALGTFPRPVGLWFATHAPAPGKPERWAEEQGADHVKRYNRDLENLLDVLAPGEIVDERGAMKVVDWYNVTDGAESYDGTHYSYQVNMEKALILLNLLDTVWGEAVAVGGLLETF